MICLFLPEIHIVEAFLILLPQKRITQDLVAGLQANKLSATVAYLITGIGMHLDHLFPCKHPVMLVKLGQWDEVGQVLAAVNIANDDQVHREMNTSILETASSLADRLDFELHLVTAYPAPPVFVPVSAAAETLKNYRTKMLIGLLGGL